MQDDWSVALQITRRGWQAQHLAGGPATLYRVHGEQRWATLG